MGSIFTKKKKFSLITYLPVLLLIAVLFFFVVFANSFAQTNLAHERDFLESALNRCITQCYALEGTYPYDLSYLEEHYGLTYNKEHFFIDYCYIGDNLRPDITIIEKE